MKAKIKILHYIWSANFGGIEKLVIQLVQEQMNDPELEVCLMIGCRKGNLLSTLDTLKINHFFCGLKSGYDLNYAKHKAIKGEINKFDIIHIHTFNYLVSLAASLSKAKIIYTIHGNFNFGRKTRWNDKIVNYLKKRILNNSVDLITFNSNWSRKISEQKFGLGNQNKIVIYNGIVTDNCSEIKYLDVSIMFPIVQNKFIIGTTSRFDGSKRIDRLVDAFAIFSKDKNDVLLLLVGDGVLKSDLEQLVKKNNIEHNTCFTGFQENVGAFQNIMNVCVFAGQNEAFGLAALETLNMGKPTIMFNDAGGMLEIQSEESINDIVENVKELSSRLDYYYINKNADQSNIINVRKNNTSKFNFITMLLEYKKCYVSILNTAKQL